VDLRDGEKEFRESWRMTEGEARRSLELTAMVSWFNHLPTCRATPDQFLKRILTPPFEIIFLSKENCSDFSDRRSGIAFLLFRHLVHAHRKKISTLLHPDGE
jgi:hypothetical protein